MNPRPRRALIQLRASRNLTQRAVGELAGIAERVVWKAEAGHPVRPLTAGRILRALEVELPRWGDYFPDLFGADEEEGVLA